MNTTALLVMNGILLLSVIPLLGLTFRKAKRAKQAQERIVETLGRGDSDDWCRIYVARAPHFSRQLKLVGFEARGVLVNLQDRVRIIAELPSGERLGKSYAKDNLGLRWIGNAGLASSNLHWIAIGPAEEPLMLSADTGFNAIQSREATADICRRINAEFRLPDIAKLDFALEKNPASLAAVSAFFVLLAFALGDGIFLNKNELLQAGAMKLGMPVLMLCALPVYWWLSRTRVPSRESLTLSMLMAIAICLAYFPAIKRVDQLLSDTGSQSFAYRLGRDASLEPISFGPPKIDYSNRKEYWAQFDEGSIHHFDLTHGPLGLWQLDHSRLDKEMRQFYEGRRKDKK